MARAARERAATPGDLPERHDALLFEAVTFGYDPAAPIVERFDWRVEQGEFWAVLGPSGSGKTTLLYLAAGIRRPVAGVVRVAGEPLLGPRRDIALMLQDYGLLPWYSARRNVEVGLAIAGVPRAERRWRSRQWLHRLGLEPHAERYPNALSGGQRQRVALARVLALEPRLLLLDEPLAAVDELTREALQRELYTLSRAAGGSTVLVTHNVEEAALLADKILLLGAHGPIRDAEVLTSPFAQMPRRDDPRFTAFCQRIRARLGL